MKVWINTEIVDSNDVSLDVDGWPQGSGIFETLRTENSEVFELSRHMRRAIDSAERLGIKLPSENLVREAIASVLVSESNVVGRLRLLFSAKDFLVVHQSYEDLRNPQKVCVQTESAKTQEFVMKSYPYTNRLELLASVKKNGFDEVICINDKNDVTEGAVSNFAFLLDGNWVTPPLSAGVLPGVVRAIAIERCGVKVRSISLDEVANIEGALVLSSLKIALPVVSIDDRQLLIKGEAKTLEALIRAKTQKHSVG